MSSNYFKLGDYSAICDMCGFSFKASQLKKTWNGFWVCEKDYEPRHILDFIKVPKPTAPLPFTRPEPADTFVSVTYISESTGVQEQTIPEVTPGMGGLL